MMGMIYMTDGRTKQVRPSNGEFWTFDEKQAIVKGYPEVVRTVDDRWMVINDAGKVTGLELNIPATRLYIHGRTDVVMGDVLVVDTWAELEEPLEIDITV
jgi:hypothetical protein